MRRRLMVVGLALAGALYALPGESIVQFGLRKIAFEQGVKAASQAWDFDAAPRASDPMPEATRAATRKVAKR